MRAAVMYAVGEPLAVEDVKIADPIGGHEVLIRTAAAGLCHSDLLFLSGEWDHPIPTILGHEVAGVVEAVGDQVTYLQPGDHVIGCAGGPVLPLSLLHRRPPAALRGPRPRPPP